jgi:hypothetical protein
MAADQDIVKGLAMWYHTTANLARFLHEYEA